MRFARFYRLNSRCASNNGSNRGRAAGGLAEDAADQNDRWCLVTRVPKMKGERRKPQRIHSTAEVVRENHVSDILRLRHRHHRALDIRVPAAAQTVNSRWKDQEIKIDGAAGEWPVLTPLDDNIAIAAANDAQYLYLAIATSDVQRRRQFAITGLIVWVDAAGGKKETFGIRIPGSGFQMPAGRFGGGASGDGRSSQPPEPPQPKITYIELLGPGKDDRRRLDLSPESEITVAAAVNEGTLLYEFRLPLAAASAAQPSGIGAKMDRPVGLGLQTPKLEVPQGGGQSGGGGRGGFGRGGRGGGGFGDGGMRGRGPMQMKELKLWTTLALARETR